MPSPAPSELAETKGAAARVSMVSAAHREAGALQRDQQVEGVVGLVGECRQERRDPAGRVPRHICLQRPRPSEPQQQPRCSLLDPEADQGEPNRRPQTTPFNPLA